MTERNGRVSYDKLRAKIEGNFFTRRDGSAVGQRWSGATDEDEPTAALMDDTCVLGMNGAIGDDDIARRGAANGDDLFAKTGNHAGHLSTRTIMGSNKHGELTEQRR